MVALTVRWLVVFALVAGLDYLWAAYITFTAQGKPFRASFAAAFLTAMSAVVTLSYVEDRTLVLPAIFGAFAGTYLHVRRSAKDVGSATPPAGP